ncbi:uncharacterized protein LOC128731889 [Anopheles nili]|uniref:uncharacterized protein LOC128731889 n=1 Tax=Anopheles nili TaxID=185578 RepID=UPI00237B39C0|nr:uncharacterized protein LOC128731889 [Anopheles nili]
MSCRRSLVQLPVLVGLLIVLIGSRLDGAYGSSSAENRANLPSQHCLDLNPQQGLDLEQIMGIWYGNEVITHGGYEEGEVVYKTCVVIHLADVMNQTTFDYNTKYADRLGSTYNVRLGTSYGYGASGGGHSGHQGSNQGQYDPQNRRQQGSGGYQYQGQQQHQEPNSMRLLRLIWDESENTLEYTLRYNTSRPGFWLSAAPQSGSLAQLQYVQFTGTVQVLKAINNQLVLNFCQSLPGGQQFTVVLSRLPMGLGPEDIQSIRNMLRRRGLSTMSIRKVCQNAGFRSEMSLITFVLLAVASAFVKRLH